MSKKFVFFVFQALVFLSLLTPFWVFKDLLFPYVTSKAFYFRIVVEAALPFYVYLLFSDKALRPKIKNWLNISVLTFLALNIVSAFLGDNILKSFWGNFERMGGVFYLAHLTALYFYILLLAQTGGSRLKRVLQAMILLAAIVALNGISGYLGGPILIADPSLPARASSVFGNPIYFPSYLILPMFLSAFFALREEKRGLKILYWLGFVFMLTGVYISGTRGALVGLVAAAFVSVVVYLFFSKNRRVKLIGGIGATVFVILLGLAFSQGSRFAEGSLLRRLTQLDDSNSQARLIQWKTALKGFKDSSWFGIGPENYYIIADKYYNPQIYKYDPSWFDKPHNYLLEILVTDGVFGFGAYLCILIFGILGLYSALKNELIDLPEAVLLFCGFMAYQAQNLFVFDSVSSSLAFYLFLGFIGYLYWEGGQLRPVAKFSGQDKKTNFNLPALPATIGFVSGLIMLYVLYVGNIYGIRAAKATNFGFVYALADPQKSYDYFQTAINLPFNFDPLETSGRFADSAVNLLRNPPTGQSDFVMKYFNSALTYEEQVNSEISNDPISLQRLVNLYLSEAIVSKQPLNPKAQKVLDKALALAPLRPELETLQARIYLFQNQTDKAEQVLKTLVDNFPSNLGAKMQFALFYNYTDRQQQAVVLAEQALDAGYQPSQAQDVLWLFEYYVQNHNMDKALAVLELAEKAEPESLDVARAYVQIGNNNKARYIATQAETLNPNLKGEAEAFIKSLK